MAVGLTISTTSNIERGQKTMIAKAIEAFEPAAPDPDLVMKVNIPPGNKIWDFLIFGRLAQATQLTEGVDLAQTEQLVASIVTLNPDEHGIIVTLSTKLLRRQASGDPQALAGRQMGGSLRRRMANDIIALYAGFGTSAPGAGSALDITYVRGAMAYLRTDNNSSYGPSPMPIHACFHPEQISDIVLDVSDPGTAAGSRPAGFGDEMLQNWYRGSDRVYGVQFWECGNIARDASGDSTGAIKAQDSLVIGMETDADATRQVDESARITEYGLFQSWTEVEVADPWGVGIVSDTAATFA